MSSQELHHAKFSNMTKRKVCAPLRLLPGRSYALDRSQAPWLCSQVESTFFTFCLFLCMTDYIPLCDQPAHSVLKTTLHEEPKLIASIPLPLSFLPVRHEKFLCHPIMLWVTELPKTTIHQFRISFLHYVWTQLWLCEYKISRYLGEKKQLAD